MAKIVMGEGENDFVGAMVFHRRVKLLMDEMQPGEDLTINLNNLYVDSSVLGTLLAIYASCKRQGRRMSLANISGETRKLLQITGVESLFNVCGESAEGAPDA